ncbi:hypothetical protein [Cerasicoccus fimbriatus]|uniref:hypothetical protein n=1 Tax=Cerasicoccus fimbriatus TaxID=3014554 RepID=UPI0022B4C793|nr:hypothetical protein [Cerasicoccus sp. TK19100]
MKFCAVIITVLLHCQNVFGTGQVPDILILNGEERGIRTNPLNQWFEWTGERTDFLEYFQEGECSACWRGYIATWKITNNKLYLEKIQNFDQDKVMPLTEIWPEQGDEPVFAEWYSGLLSIPEGELLNYVHMGYSSIYARDMLLRVDSGIIVDRKVRDNRIWFLKRLLGDDGAVYNFPDVKLPDMSLKEAVEWTYKVMFEYTTEREDLEKMIGLLNIEFSYLNDCGSQTVSGYTEKNVPPYDAFEHIAQAAGCKMKVIATEDGLILQFDRAN